MEEFNLIPMTQSKKLKILLEKLIGSSKNSIMSGLQIKLMKLKLYKSIDCSTVTCMWSLKIYPKSYPTLRSVPFKMPFQNPNGELEKKDQEQGIAMMSKF